MRNRVEIVSFLLLLAVGCTGKIGESVVVTPEPPGANCAAGGARVQVGQATPTYVCNGATGADGQGAVVSTESPGANCAAGGVKVQVGSGSPTYVCNGATGANGQSATVSAEAPGANCAAGGVKVEVGSGSPTFVCNGATGANGLSALVATEPMGTNCASGGVKIQVGGGAPTYVCNGASGADGQSVVATAVAPGSTCAAGGVTLQVGSGTPIAVCNGATGADGQSVAVASEPPGVNCVTGGIQVQVGSGAPSYLCNGATGSPGTSCSILTVGEDVMLTCTDGTSALIKHVYSVGGTVSGLLAGGLVLRNEVASSAWERRIDVDGPYAYPGFDAGASYSVSVIAQPPTQVCTVSAASGTIAAASVAAVDVACACGASLGNCDGDPANGCETNLDADNANCGACGLACTGSATCVAGACTEPVRSFDVGSGPVWDPDPPAYSCVEACALNFGGSPSSWACSTSRTTVDHLGWYSGFGDGSHCGPEGSPFAEDYKPGATYWVGGFSAFIDDWCGLGTGSINYCFPTGL